MPDGSILVAEMGNNSIVRASGPHFKQRVTVAKGVSPMQMTMDRDGTLYVTEAAGALTPVNLADGSKTTIASGLADPSGVAQTPWGTFIVLEGAANRLTEIDAGSDERRTVASNLQVGAPEGANLPPAGAAVDAQGNVYVSSDLNNAIYKVRPLR